MLMLLLPEYDRCDLRGLTFVAHRETAWLRTGPKVLRHRSYLWDGRLRSLEAWRIVKYGPPKVIKRSQLDAMLEAAT